MNYDGIAIVIDYSKNDFKSINGFCDIIVPNSIQNTSKDYHNESQVIDNNIYYIKNKTSISESYAVLKNDVYGVTPFTANVSSLQNTTDFYPVTVFSYLSSQDKQYNINYEKTAPVSFIVRTNAISKKFSTNVIDKESSVVAIEFPYITTNVTDKTQITIPDNTEIRGLSIVIQKNSFVEIELQKDPSGVSGIPDGLTWNKQYISGTITKSGTYIIKITYPDGDQILDITVPYYQRLL